MPGVKSELQMEMILNLVWVLGAIASVALWLRVAHRNGASPRAQFVARLLLLVIVFPVISVTDDLQALQNPAELDCCARRHHAASCTHSILSAVAAPPPLAMAELSSSFMRVALPDNPPLPLKTPALESIRSRPPPAA